LWRALLATQVCTARLGPDWTRWPQLISVGATAAADHPNRPDDRVPGQRAQAPERGVLPESGRRSAPAAARKTFYDVGLPRRAAPAGSAPAAPRGRHARLEAWPAPEQQQVPLRRPPEPGANTPQAPQVK
jgi:hypothetical protein